MSIKIDLYKLLGLPDPTLETEPGLAKVSDYPTVWWKNFTEWCSENRLLLAVVGVGLVVLYVVFRRTG